MVICVWRCWMWKRERIVCLEKSCVNGSLVKTAIQPALMLHPIWVDDENDWLKQISSTISSVLLSSFESEGRWMHNLRNFSAIQSLWRIVEWEKLLKSLWFISFPSDDPRRKHSRWTKWSCTYRIKRRNFMLTSIENSSAICFPILKNHSCHSCTSDNVHCVLVQSV